MSEEIIAVPIENEIIFFENKDAFLSNKRFIFKGLLNNSKIFKDYEISPDNINESLKNPDPDNSNLIAGAIMAFLPLFGISAILLNGPIGFLISLIICILAVKQMDKKAIESNRNTIRINVIKNSDYQSYLINLPKSMAFEDVLNILKEFEQKNKIRSKKEDEIRKKEIKDKENEINKKNLEIQIEAGEKKKEKLEKFRTNLMSIYYNTSNFCIKIDDYKGYLDILNLNQDKVIEIDHKYIRDFLRVATILELLNLKIEGYFQKINNSHHYKELVDLKIDLDNDINLYQNTLALGLTMLSSLISKNLVAFYGIYEQFDSSGIFDSHHEMRVQKNLDEINKNIENLGSKVEKITTAVYQMGYLNGSKLDSLNNVISAELIRVNSNISYPRLIENLVPFAPAVGLVAGYKLGYNLTGPSKK